MAEFNFDDLFQEDENSWPLNESLSALKNSQTIPEIIINSDETDDTNSVSLKKLRWEDYDILRLIGKGAYGQVYQAIWKGNNRVCAIKVLKKDFLFQEGAIANTITEKEVLEKARNPFVVKLYGAFQTQERVALVMEYINGGQLFFHLRNEANFFEDVARFYTAELILALEYLHSHHIIHRDLKPENILISSAGHIVLTDFGLAKQGVEEDSASTFCGTIEYMAPEMIKGEKYGKAADFWSVGILLFDMLSGAPPFRHRNQKKLEEKIISAKITMPSFWDSTTHSIIRELTMKDPKKRIKLDGIKKHPFFTKKLNWNKLINMEVPVPFVPKVPDGALDVSNFSPSFTSINKPSFSPAGALTGSQEAMFNGFSFARSFTPTLPKVNMN